jgi:hypothetical protein
VSRRPPHAGAGAPRPPKAVSPNSRRGRVAPRLRLLPGGLEVARLTDPDARRVVSVLPSRGRMGHHLLAKVTHLSPAELAATITLLADSGWVVIHDAGADHMAVSLTESARLARRASRPLLAGEQAA